MARRKEKLLVGSALAYLALLLSARSRWGGGEDDLGENVDYCCNRYCCCQLTCGRTGRMRNQGIGGGLAIEQNPVEPVGIASRRGGPVLFFVPFSVLIACLCFVLFPQVFCEQNRNILTCFSFFLINICSPVKYPFTSASGAVFAAALVLSCTTVFIAQLFNLAVTFNPTTERLIRTPSWSCIYPVTMFTGCTCDKWTIKFCLQQVWGDKLHLFAAKMEKLPSGTFDQFLWIKIEGYCCFANCVHKCFLRGKKDKSPHHMTA